MEVSRRKRRVRGSTESIGVVILIAMGLVLLNAIAMRLFTRLDLTQDKIYTLSSSSRTVLSRLDDIINVHVYYKEMPPPQFMRVRQQVGDLLEEYLAYAKGMLRVEWIDPIGNPELEQRARSLGLQPVQMQAIERDEARIAVGYMAIVVMYEDRREIVPLGMSTANLEYQLTSAILKVSTTESLTVGIVAPSNPDQASGLNFLHRSLEQQYHVLDVSLEGEEASIPEEVSTLVLVGSPVLSDRGKWEIDQFLMRGKRAMFLVDAVEVPQASLNAYPSPPSYDDLLRHYGVSVHSDLVLDASSARAPFSSGAFQVMVKYPFWVRVIQNGFDRENPVVNELGSLILPWTSSVKALPLETTEVVTLASSTEQAWVQEGYFNLAPTQPFQEMGGNLRVVPLAVAVTGKLKSFFEGQDPPLGVIVGQEGQGERLDASTTDTQILVVGCSRWVTDFFLNMFPNNLTFLLNSVDWLTLGPDLIAVRSRGGLDRPLGPVDEGTRTLLKLFSIAVMPGVVILFGVVWSLIRRRARRLVEVF